MLSQGGEFAFVLLSLACQVRPGHQGCTHLLAGLTHSTLHTAQPDKPLQHTV